MSLTLLSLLSKVRDSFKILAHWLLICSKPSISRITLFGLPNWEPYRRLVGKVFWKFGLFLSIVLNDE